MFNSKFKKLKVALAVAAISPRMLLKSTPSAKNKK